MAENKQKWEKNRKGLQKPTKSGRKQTKMTENLGKCGVLQIIFCQVLISVLPSSYFCPARLPFLSCQAPIFVLPSSHFCPAKLTNFSKAPPAPPPATPMGGPGEVSGGEKVWGWCEGVHIADHCATIRSSLQPTMGSPHNT